VRIADTIAVVVRPLPPPLQTCLTLCVGAILWAGSASAQAAPARPTGIFFRAGPTVSGFGLSAMTFRLQDRVHLLPGMESAPTPSFTGKQISLGREWLGGVSLSAHVDGPWFYVRVGADVYANFGSVAEDYRVDSTVLGWIAAGPRFVFGHFSVLAGLRVGALVVDLSLDEVTSAGERRHREYTGIGPLYAIDVGAQWRPLRWVQVDVSVGQDLLGVMLATTASLNVNVGWSAIPR